MHWRYDDCYLRNNQNFEALELYKEYGALQSDVTHLLAIKACINANDYEYGQRIIHHLNASNNKNSVQLLCTFIDFYAMFEDIDRAKKIFVSIPHNKINNVLINAMMNALIKNNDSARAVSVYQKYSALHDDTSHLLAIKACMDTDNKSFAEQLIQTKISHKHSIQLQSVLIDYYAKYDNIESALNVFGSIPKDGINAMALNAMIKGYVHNNMHNLALSLYESYPLLHDEVSHIFALKAMRNGLEFENAQNIIEQHINYNNTKCSIQLLSALMDFYSKFNRIDTISKIFGSVPDAKKDAFCIGLMMKCLYGNDQNENVLDLYRRFDHLGDDVLTLFALKACTNLNDYNYGKQIIGSRSKNAAKSSTELMNGMIEFYGKLGDINNAKDIFTAMGNKQRNIETYNNMLHSYYLNKRYLEAMDLYKERMKDIHPDAVTVTILLKICTRGNMENIGKEIYKKYKLHHILNGTNVQISLMNLNAQLNDLDGCKEIFSKIAHPQIEHWNAMLNAYGRNGKIKECMQLFEELKEASDKKPNHRTCSILLNAFIEADDSKYFEMGKQMVGNNENAFTKHSDLSCKLIEFYGQYGDIENAMNIFLQNQDIVSSIHMLKVLVNNGLNHRSVTFYNEYVKNMPIDINKLILSGNGTFLLNSLLARLLHFGYPQNAESIWNDIMFKHKQNKNLLSQIFYTHTLKLFILCIDKSSEYYKHHPNDNFNLNQIWNLLVKDLGIKPNLRCYCCAILACSKYGVESREFIIFDQIVSDLLNDTKMIDELRSISTINPKPFCQILTGLGLLNKCDQMWKIYHLIIGEYHSIDALNVLIEYEQNEHRAKEILDIIKATKYLSTCSLCKSYNVVNRKCTRYNQRNPTNCIIHRNRNEDDVRFDVNNVHLFQLIALLRAAIKFEDDELKKYVLAILNNPRVNQLESNIVAMFRLNGQHYLMQNEVDRECSFDSMSKLNQLMAESGYEIDTSVCVGSLINANVREKHLKYHAEKKALAILLNQSDLHDAELSVTVSMKMCRDCHNFFGAMSKYTQRQIKCIDPEMEHLFENGKCTQCYDSY